METVTVSTDNISKVVSLIRFDTVKYANNCGGMVRMLMERCTEYEGIVTRGDNDCFGFGKHIQISQFDLIFNIEPDCMINVAGTQFASNLFTAGMPLMMDSTSLMRGIGFGAAITFDGVILHDCLRTEMNKQFVKRYN